MTPKPFVFMVMPFADTTANQVYDNIVKPLCSELGYDVKRADEYVTTQVIYDEIVQSIQEATIVIVDISGKNPNVMFELGIAHALRQPSTIILTHDDVTNSPFDIKHFRINEYENSIAGGEKLKTKLRDTIITIQKLGHAAPTKLKPTTLPTETDNRDEDLEREKVKKIFNRLSDSQRKLLKLAVQKDKRQWLRNDMNSGDFGHWTSEMEVLIQKGIVKQVGSDAFLIDDGFFDVLQEIANAN